MTDLREPDTQQSPRRLDAGSIGTLLRHRVEQQVVVLRAEESRVRAEDASGIHKMRIAVRRLRSALATYRPVLIPDSTDALRDELRWLGGELSPARDAQVLRERFDALLAEQPAELVMGPVANRIHTEMAARYQAGRRRGLEALDSERYAALLRALDAFVQTPPYAEAAALPATEELPRLLDRDLRRLRRRADAAAAAVEAGAATRDPALHETRKAAKRVRYAAESAVPVFGKRAKKLARRAEQVQEVLGEHQDTVVARTTLRELGAKAYLEHENGFTFGRLHALEEARAERLVEGYPEALRRLPRKPVGRWITA